MANITKEELNKLRTLYEEIHLWNNLGIFNFCQESSDECHDHKDKLIIEWKKYLSGLFKKYNINTKKYSLRGKDGEFIEKIEKLK